MDHEHSSLGPLDGIASTGKSSKNQTGDAEECIDDSRLRSALDSIAPKSYSAFSPVLPPSYPEILVHDVGQITLPLSEAQAKQLIVKAQHAPFEKDNDTSIDNSVRNIWELDPAQFEIRGASWQSQLDNMLSAVRYYLDIGVPITAEIHKMLIYEKGATSKANIDTAKIPGMLGTLVVSLPSPHEGGNVVVRHCGFEKTLHTKKDMTCAFWYSEVSHQVLPVMAGYRWVLTYNLMVDSADELPTANSIPDNLWLRSALQSWSRAVEDGLMALSPRYWLLHHRYPGADLSHQRLGALDRERVRQLKNICTELGFDLFLVTLEKEVIYQKLKTDAGFQLGITTQFTRAAAHGTVRSAYLI
ncbi:hypothetical protein GGR52DRAFT_570597 [Hypoxylon sp. FL1284]|nr:hypothetical protein GGR52DRAFT_570597 [Hypoxylon sp. FL1284]